MFVGNFSNLGSVGLSAAKEFSVFSCLVDVHVAIIGFARQVSPWSHLRSSVPFTIQQFKVWQQQVCDVGCHFFSS